MKYVRPFMLNSIQHHLTKIIHYLNVCGRDKKLYYRQLNRQLLAKFCVCFLFDNDHQWEVTSTTPPPLRVYSRRPCGKALN